MHRYCILDISSFTLTISFWLTAHETEIHLSELIGGSYICVVFHVCRSVTEPITLCLMQVQRWMLIVTFHKFLVVDLLLIYHSIQPPMSITNWTTEIKNIAACEIRYQSVVCGCLNYPVCYTNSWPLSKCCLYGCLSDPVCYTNSWYVRHCLLLSTACSLYSAQHKTKKLGFSTL